MPQILRALLFVNALVLVVPMVSITTRLLVCHNTESSLQAGNFGLVSESAGIQSTSGEAFHQAMQTSLVREAFGSDSACWTGAHLGMFFVVLLLLPAYIVASVLGFLLLVDREMDSVQLLAHADPHADVMDMQWLMSVAFLFQIVSDVIDLWFLDLVLLVGFTAWAYYLALNSEWVNVTVNDTLVALQAGAAWTLVGATLGVLFSRDIDVGPVVVLGVAVAAALGFFVTRARRTAIVSTPLKRLVRVADIVVWARHRVQLAVEGHSVTHSYSGVVDTDGALAALLDDASDLDAEYNEISGVAGNSPSNASVFGAAQLHGNSRALVKDAELGYQALVERHPRAALASLHAALFYKATRANKNSYLELRMLARAWRLSSAWDVRLIVVLRTYHVNFNAGAASNSADVISGSSVMGADLSGIQRIVYDHHQTSARTAETSAYHTMHTVYSQLQQPRVDLGALHNLAMTYAGYRKTADTSFKNMLRMNPSSPEVLRSYAAFLTRSFQEEQLAVALLSKAERLEATASRVHVHKVTDFTPGGHGGAASGEARWGANSSGGVPGGLDDNSAVLVVSAGELDFGDIIACNAASCRIFGRLRGEMLGSNLRLLLPSPFNAIPTSDLDRLARLADSYLNNWQYMAGVHANGTLIPLRIMLQEAPPAIAGACDPRFALVCQQLQLADVAGIAIVRGNAADDGLSLVHASGGMHSLLGIDASTIAEYDLPIGAWMPALDRAWRGEPLHGKRSGGAQPGSSFNYQKVRSNGIRHRSAQGQSLAAPPPRSVPGYSSGGGGLGPGRGRRRSHRASSTSSWSNVTLTDEVVKLRACLVTPKGVQVMRPKPPPGTRLSNSETTSDSDKRQSQAHQATNARRVSTILESTDEDTDSAAPRQRSEVIGLSSSGNEDSPSMTAHRAPAPISAPNAGAADSSSSRYSMTRKGSERLKRSGSSKNLSRRPSAHGNFTGLDEAATDSIPIMEQKTADGRPLVQLVSVTVIPLSGMFLGSAAAAMFDVTYYGFVMISKHTEYSSSNKALNHRNVSGTRTVPSSPAATTPLHGGTPMHGGGGSDDERITRRVSNASGGIPPHMSIATGARVTDRSPIALGGNESEGGSSSSAASAMTQNTAYAPDAASVNTKLTKGTYNGAVGLAAAGGFDGALQAAAAAERTLSRGSLGSRYTGHMTDMTEEQSEYVIDNAISGGRKRRKSMAPTEQTNEQKRLVKNSGMTGSVGTRATAVSSTMAMLQMVVAQAHVSGLAPLKVVNRIFRSSLISMVLSTLVLFFAFFFLLHDVMSEQLEAVGDTHRRWMGAWVSYHNLISAGGITLAGLSPLSFSEEIADMRLQRAFLSRVDEAMLRQARSLSGFTPVRSSTLELLTERDTIKLQSAAAAQPGSPASGGVSMSLLEALNFFDVRTGSFVQFTSPAAFWPNSTEEVSQLGASGLSDISPRSAARELREEVIPALRRLALEKGPDVESHLFFQGWLDMGLMITFITIRGIVFGLIALRAARDFDRLKNSPLKAMASMNTRTLKLLQERSADNLRSALGVDEDDELWPEEADMEEDRDGHDGEGAGEEEHLLGKQGSRSHSGGTLVRTGSFEAMMNSPTPQMHLSPSHMNKYREDAQNKPVLSGGLDAAHSRSMQGKGVPRRGSVATYASSQFSGATGDTGLREMLAHRNFARTLGQAAATPDGPPPSGSHGGVGRHSGQGSGVYAGQGTGIAPVVEGRLEPGLPASSLDRGGAVDPAVSLVPGKQTANRTRTRAASASALPPATESGPVENPLAEADSKGAVGSPQPSAKVPPRHDRSATGQAMNETKAAAGHHVVQFDDTSSAMGSTSSAERSDRSDYVRVVGESVSSSSHREHHASDATSSSYSGQYVSGPGRQSYDKTATMLTTVSAATAAQPGMSRMSSHGSVDPGAVTRGRRLSKVEEGLLTPHRGRRRTKSRRLPTVRTFRDTAGYRRWATVVLLAPTLIVMVHIATVIVVQMLLNFTINSSTQRLHAASEASVSLMQQQADFLAATISAETMQQQYEAANATIAHQVVVRSTIQQLIHGGETDFLPRRVSNVYASSKLSPLDVKSSTYIRLQEEGCIISEPEGLKDTVVMKQHIARCVQYNDGLVRRGLLDGVSHYLTLTRRAIEVQASLGPAAGGGARIVRRQNDTTSAGDKTLRLLVGEAIELHTVFLAPGMVALLEQELQESQELLTYYITLVHVTNLASGLTNFFIMILIAYPLVSSLTNHVLASRALMLTLPPEVVQQVPRLRKELVAMTNEVKGVGESERTAMSVAAMGASASRPSQSGGGSGGGGTNADVNSLLMRADVVLGRSGGVLGGVLDDTRDH